MSQRLLAQKILANVKNISKNSFSGLGQGRSLAEGLKNEDKTMKKLICRLIGHQPRGPVKDRPILYRCDRCDRLIRFNRDRGWLIYHE